MEGAGVEYELEARADARLAQRGHVTMHEAHLDARLVHPLAGTVEGLLDDIDAGHLPAPLRQPHAPDRASGSEVERGPVGWLAPVLLASDQLEELPGEGRMLSQILPGVKADRVGEPVVHRCPRAAVVRNT